VRQKHSLSEIVALIWVGQFYRVNMQGSTNKPLLEYPMISNLEVQ